MIYVLLPAYNEEAGIPKVLNALLELEQLSETAFQVVVVNDGSVDETSAAAKSFQGKLRIQVIDFPQNQGVRQVFEEGFRYICKSSQNPTQDLCVVLDSDNTQDPKLILAMQQKIRNGDDLVIASRFEGEGKMIGCPWHRQLLSFGVSWLMRIAIGIPGVKDYSTFYRAYRVSLLKKAFDLYGNNLVQGEGFSVAANILIKLSRLTSRISEISLILRYDQKAGRSGIKIFKTIKGYLGVLWGFWNSHDGCQCPTKH